MTGDQNTLVAELNKCEIKRSYAQAALRNLVSNLLRVMAGGGTPGRLYQDLMKAATVFKELAEMHPGRIDSAFEDALPKTWLINDQMSGILRGSLRLMAAKILNQSTQLAISEREIAEGVYSFSRKRR